MMKQPGFEFLMNLTTTILSWLGRTAELGIGTAERTTEVAFVRCQKCRILAVKGLKKTQKEQKMIKKEIWD